MHQQNPLKCRVKNIDLQVFKTWFLFSSILTTNDLSTGIFDPKISSGLCRYEVVYTNTSTVGINKICFLVW